MGICEFDKPDFKFIVDRTIAVFAVYTGATLTFFVKDFLFSRNNLETIDFCGWATYWGSWVVIAVIALLLRYIVGSAVQLNRAYVPKESLTINGPAIKTVKSYDSKSVCWLFFDMLFLIAFGIIAFFLTTGTTIDGFMWRAICFVAGGFTWSLIAVAFSRGSPKVAKAWLWIDGIQIVFTLWLLYLDLGDLTKSVILAIFYLLFLFADLCVLARPNLESSSSPDEA
jgi:hypothetical protein